MHINTRFIVLCTLATLLFLLGCSDPQQKLWDEHAQIEKEVTPSNLFTNFPLQIEVLKKIKKENPNAQHPSDKRDVDAMIKQLEDSLDELGGMQRSVDSLNSARDKLKNDLKDIDSF